MHGTVARRAAEVWTDRQYSNSVGILTGLDQPRLLAWSRPARKDPTTPIDRSELSAGGAIQPHQTLPMSTVWPVLNRPSRLRQSCLVHHITSAFFARVQLPDGQYRN